ncbi:MAG: RDD family protein [Aeromonadaceae bacterium]|nr:RDD family protein [Aeromonadaceae bacterium]
MARSKTTRPTPTPSAQPRRYPVTGLFRRLGAWLLDALLAGALLLLAGVLGYGLAWLLQLIGLVKTGESSLGDWLSHQTLYSVYLGLVLCGYYLWFWCRTGQTPGMKPWHLRLQRPDGQRLGLAQGLIRLFTAAFGLGNLLAPFDHQRRAFQDIWAESEMVVENGSEAKPAA